MANFMEGVMGNQKPVVEETEKHDPLGIKESYDEDTEANDIHLDPEELEALSNKD